MDTFTLTYAQLDALYHRVDDFSYFRADDDIPKVVLSRPFIGTLSTDVILTLSDTQSRTKYVERYDATGTRIAKRKEAL